jgi:hypothetical protein
MSKNAHVPFMIQGPTSDPKFVPDVGGIIGGAVESELGKALGDNPKNKGLRVTRSGASSVARKRKTSSGLRSSAALRICFQS